MPISNHRTPDIDDYALKGAAITQNGRPFFVRIKFLLLTPYENTALEHW